MEWVVTAIANGAKRQWVNHEVVTADDHRAAVACAVKRIEDRAVDSTVRVSFTSVTTLHGFLKNELLGE